MPGHSLTERADTTNLLLQNHTRSRHSAPRHYYAGFAQSLAI